MEPYFWDGQIEYLKKTGSLYYNEDYIRFLVERVWRITSPVDMLDYGCGFGHLGLRLLPLLPSGSKYTGIDAGTDLIRRARELFRHSPFETEFIEGDFHAVAFERKYDLVLCHAVLLHMTDPMPLLRKMRDSVKPGGKIIAFEPHWNGNHAGYYFEGMELSEVMPLGLLQELFERDLKRTGKDGNIGIRLPVYFNALGLRDVQCRVSDKVNVYDPSVPGEGASKLYDAMRFADPGEYEPYVRGLIDRGMSPEEARRQYEAEKRLAQAFTPSTAAVYSPGMKITFGTVE